MGKPIGIVRILCLCGFLAAKVWAADEIDGINVSDGLLKTTGGNAAATAESGYQKLGSGTYTITNPPTTIDISTLTSDNKNLYIDTGTSLTVTPTDTTTAFKVNNLTVAGGSFTAHGGDTTALYFVDLTGTDIQGTLTQSGGVITAISEGLSNYATRGLSANSFSQSGGEFVAAARGKTSGAFFTNLTQTVGKITVTAGDGPTGYGLYAGNATIADELIIKGGGVGRAMQVGSTQGNMLTFKSTSKLTVDCGESGALPYIYAKGINIESGASVDFANTSSIAAGTSSHVFMKTLYGITGDDFTLLSSPTLNISIAKTRQIIDGSTLEYTVYFDRSATGGDVVAGRGNVPWNVQNFMASLNPLYGDAAFNNDPRNSELVNDLTAIDTMGDAGQIADYSLYMTQKYAPLDLTTAIANLATSVNGMTQTAMTRNLFAPTDGLAASAAASGSSDALASLATSSGVIKSFWLTPLAQWVQTKPLSNDFVKSNQNIFGTGLGFGIRQEHNFAFGVGAHYLRSNLRSHTAAIDSNLYGFNLFGRKYFANRNFVKPFVEGGLGYTYADAKQTRKFLGNSSDPSSHIFNANLALGFDWLHNTLTLTPRIGVDYNHIRNNAYTESGTLPLAIQSGHLNSVRGVVGVSLKHQATECLYLTANAAYRYEFGDRNALVSSSFVTTPDIIFVTEGERRSRSSGDIGVGLGWQARKNVLIGLNYDFGIAEKQYSHMVAARLSLDF